MKRLWTDSLIILDANVLLSLYRYSDSTKNEFFEVLGKLKDRLWIPHHVAKEYLRGRIKVISDQAKLYDDAIEGLLKLKGDFENPKHHPFISETVLGDCTRSFDLIIGELRSNKERHDEKVSSDDVVKFVSEIFEGKVGETYSDGRFEEIIEAGAIRYAKKVPPGFKDATKNVGATLEEKIVPYGDYVVWLQLLEKAKADGCNVIYVTGDNKDDWWLKRNGRTLGPLPELIDEFVSVTSRQFYMYLPDRFLKYAGEFLQQVVSAQALEETRDARAEVPANEDSVRITNVKLSEMIRRSSRGNLAKALGIQVFDSSTNGWLDVLSAEEETAKAQLRKLGDDLSDAILKLRDLEQEADQRLIDGPTERFSDLDDHEVLSHLELARRDRDELRRKIERLRSIYKGSVSE